MGKLDNKVAVITGAAGGIGRAAAKLFAQESAKLMLVDLDEASLLSMVEEIGPEQASYVTADVSIVNDVKNYIDKTLSLFEKIDITLLNAGIEGKIASIQDQTDEDFDKVLAVNIRGVWLGLKYIMPALSENGGGSIVITSSTAGIRATPGLSPYITSKHAVIGLMRAGAMEGAKDNIRVNTVNPSPIETDMIYRIEDEINPNRGNKQPMADNTP